MVRSIDRGLDVMELVGRAREPMPLPEITARMELPRTTAFNIVRTLVQRGALEAVGSKGYRLGPLVTELAQVRAPARDLITRVRPMLEKLGQGTGETAMLSVLSDDEIVFVDKVESPQAVRYTVQVGTRRPLYCSAHGKVVLATFSDDALQRYLQRVPLAPRTDKTVVDEAQLRRELARIRQQGFAASDGEFIADVYSLSAPVGQRADGTPVAMLSVVGPLARTKPARKGNATLLLACARAAGAECAGLD